MSANVMIHMFMCNGVSIVFGLIGEPIRMNPIENFPLDNILVGEVITIGCVIQSDCGAPNDVKFINEQDKVLESVMRNEDGAFNWNPIVSNDLKGTYRCVAQNPLGTASQTFMITGKYHTFADDHFLHIKCTGTPRQKSSGNNASTHIASLLFVTMLLSFLAIMYN